MVPTKTPDKGETANLLPEKEFGVGENCIGDGLPRIGRSSETMTGVAVPGTFTAVLDPVLNGCGETENLWLVIGDIEGENCIGLVVVLTGVNTDTLGCFGSSLTSLNLNGAGVLESNNCWLVNGVGVGENTCGLNVLLTVFKSCTIGFLCNLSESVIWVNTTGLGVKIIGSWSLDLNFSLEISTIFNCELFLIFLLTLRSSSFGALLLNFVWNLDLLSNFVTLSSVTLNEKLVAVLPDPHCVNT